MHRIKFNDLKTRLGIRVYINLIIYQKNKNNMNNINKI